MKLSRLGSMLAAGILALTAAGMVFSVQGNKDLAGSFIGLALVSAIALNAATKDRASRLTRDE